jgi:hypothetical protein
VLEHQAIHTHLALGNRTCCSVGALLLLCRHTVGTLLVHFCHTVVIVLLHCYRTVIALLLHFCDTLVAYKRENILPMQRKKRSVKLIKSSSPSYACTSLIYGVRVVLQWCCNGVTMVLKGCYNGVAVVFQWCYSGVTPRAR